MNSNVPEEYLCPITHAIMKQPVSLACGHTFEKNALEHWLSQKNMCPTCRKEVIGEMSINWSLKSLIDKSQNTGENRVRSAKKIMDVVEPTVDAKKFLDDLQSDLSKINAAYFEKDSKINLRLDVPKCEHGRRPISFVCLVDISGSMDETVGAAEGGKAFTRLDLVKHVLNVVVMSLTPSDQLGIVTFSDDSEIILELAYMTPDNKILAKNHIKILETAGGTNTLPGIHMCYELIKQAPKTNIQSIILLTDGQDTVGKEILLRGFKTIEKDSLVQFNTFGISNDIWSDCLSELALKGHGLFGFIPDQTMIGTVFINFIANNFELLGQGISLHLSEGFEFENGDFKKEISLCYGKSRNFLIKKNAEFKEKHPLTVKIGLGITLENSHEQSQMIELKPHVTHEKGTLDTNLARYKMLELVNSPRLPHVNVGEFEDSDEIKTVKEFILEFKQLPGNESGNNEQIKLGVQYWNTWGQVNLCFYCLYSEYSV